MTTTEIYLARINALKHLPDTDDYYSKILPATLNSNDEKIATLQAELQELQNNAEQLNTTKTETEGQYEKVSSVYNQTLEESTKLTQEIKNMKDRIQKMQDGSRPEAETDKQLIEKLRNYKNIQQRLIKLKWLANQSDQRLEAIVFNDRSAYLKYCTFDKEDSALQETIWTEIGEASRSASDLLYTSVENMLGLLQGISKSMTRFEEF